jgi:chromate transporter
MTTVLSSADWLALLVHFLSLSLLAIGGAITTAPEMHSYLVADKGWLTDSQFTSSIALAQAAPGPNVLFIAVLGWNAGMNAGGGLGAGPHAWWLALAGVGVAMIGSMLPSTTLTFVASRWAHKNRELRAVRAFKQGMAPIVVALLVATGWILATSQGQTVAHWKEWALTITTVLLVWRTRLHMLWMLGVGAVLGALGVL